MILPHLCYFPYELEILEYYLWISISTGDIGILPLDIYINWRYWNTTSGYLYQLEILEYYLWISPSMSQHPTLSQRLLRDVQVVPEVPKYFEIWEE